MTDGLVINQVSDSNVWSYLTFLEEGSILCFMHAKLLLHAYLFSPKEI